MNIHFYIHLPSCQGWGFGLTVGAAGGCRAEANKLTLGHNAGHRRGHVLDACGHLTLPDRHMPGSQEQWNDVVLNLYCHPRSFIKCLQHHPEEGALPLTCCTAKQSPSAADIPVPQENDIFTAQRWSCSTEGWMTHSQMQSEKNNKECKALLEKLLESSSIAHPGIKCLFETSQLTQSLPVNAFFFSIQSINLY